MSERIPLPLATLPRILLKELPSGTISLEKGGDGIYLRFDCDCLDALPYCRAACCALHGIDLTHEEAASGLYATPPDQDQLSRAADGYCVYNDRADHHCHIYEQRPNTCRDFHCTRGPFMRGWRLELSRLTGE